MAGERAARRVAFTMARAEAIPAPERGRTYTYDTHADGLALCVTAAGRRTWYWYGKAAGNPTRIPLGRFPSLGVEDARKRAREVSAEVSAGGNPQAERQASRKELTLGAVWESWQAHARERKREKSRREDERQWGAFLEPWSNRRLSTIGRREVAAWHRRIGSNHGRYAANRVLSLLSAMINHAIRELAWEGVNPCKGVKRFPERSRERFLSAEELPRFFQALAAEPNEAMRDFFFLCIFTGGRRGNVLAARWQDIDLHARLWRIPGEASKSGTPIVIPLCEPACEVLRRRQAESNGSAWVFPSARSKSGHLVEPKGAWRKIVARAGLEDVRIHDLRRSLGSWLAITGAPLAVIGKSLGHSQMRATEVYARLSTEPVRSAIGTATAEILRLANPQAEACDSQDTKALTQLLETREKPGLCQRGGCENEPG